MPGVSPTQPQYATHNAMMVGGGQLELSGSALRPRLDGTLATVMHVKLAAG